MLGGSGSVAQRTARCASRGETPRTPRSPAGPRRRARAVRRRRWGCLPRCAPTDSRSTKRRLQGGAAANHARQSCAVACVPCGATAAGRRLEASHPWCQRRGARRALSHAHVRSSTRPSAMPNAASHAARRARWQALQAQLRDSSRANRSDVVDEQARQREAAQKRSPAHAHKLAKAERLLDERDMRERGEDVERHRAMHYTIEENEAWEKKLEEKERSRDKGMIGTCARLTQTFRIWPSARTSGRSGSSSRTARRTPSRSRPRLTQRRRGPAASPRATASSCARARRRWRRPSRHTGPMRQTRTRWTAS